MGNFFTIGDKAIKKDNIIEAGIYSFNFPSEKKINDTPNKLAEIMCAFAGQDYFKYNTESCEILVVNVSSLSGDIDIYIIHNSDELCKTLNTAYERLNDGKFTLDGNIAATDFDRVLANFLSKYKDINFTYTEKNLKEIFNEITQ